MVGLRDLSAVPSVVPWVVSAVFGLVVLRRPDWSIPRARIVAAPVIGSVLGLAVSPLVPALSVPGAALVAALLGLVLLQLARCPVGPFLSAPVLPVLADIRSWWYPVVVLGAASLMAVLATPGDAPRWKMRTAAVHGGAVTVWLALAAVARLPVAALAAPLLVSCLEFVRSGASSVRLAALRWVLVTATAGGAVLCRVSIPFGWLACLAAVALATALVRLLGDPHPPALALAATPFVVSTDPLTLVAAVAVGAAALYGGAALVRWSLDRLTGGAHEGLDDR